MSKPTTARALLIPVTSCVEEPICKECGDLVDQALQQLEDLLVAGLPDKRHKFSGELKDRRASGYNEAINDTVAQIKRIMRGE